MKDVLKFKYNENEYFVFYSEGDFIYRKRGKDGYGDVSKEEIDLIYIVMNQLQSKKIIDLGNISLRGKEFKHFIDNNCYHMFYELQGNNLRIPAKEDLVYFNNKYNNILDYATFNFIDKIKKNQYFKRLVKIGNVVIPVLISSMILFNSLTTDNINKFDVDDEVLVVECRDAREPILDDSNKVASTAFINLREVFRDIGSSIDFFDLSRVFQDIELKFEQSNQSDNEKNQLTVEYIEELLRNNPYLTDAEKDFFLSNPAIFEDNLEYLIYDNIVENFSNLKIVYINEPFEIGKALGTYTHTGDDKNTIHIYNATCFEDAKKSVLAHEFVHSFTDWDNFVNGHGFLEAITAEMADEYFIFYKTATYPGMRNLTNGLCKIIGVETLKEYLCTANSDVIVNELLKIIPDKEMAENLMLYADIYFASEDLEIISKYKDMYMDMLKDYYVAKYNKPIESDLEFSLIVDLENTKDKILSLFALTEEEKEIARKNFSYTSSWKLYNNSSDAEDNINIEIKFTRTSNFIYEYMSLEDAYNIGVVELVDGQYISVNPESYPIMKDGTVRRTVFTNNEYENYVLENNIFDPNYIRE